MESSKMYCPSGGDTVLTSSGPETTPFHGRQYRAQNGNMRNFGPTNPHGTAFAPKQWLYQKEATGMESSKMYCHSWWRYRTYHCVAAKYPVSWVVVQGTEWKYANIRPYQSPWYCVCTKAMVISKGGYGHGESKKYCPSRCRYRTYHCVEAKYPVSWGVVYGPEWKYANLRPNQFPWYRVCNKAMVILKGSYGHGEFKNVLPQRCRYRTDQFGARNYPVSWEVVYGPEWKYSKLRAYQSPWYRVCT